MASKAARRKQAAVMEQQEADHGESRANRERAVSEDQGQKSGGRAPRQKGAPRKLPAKTTRRKTAVKRKTATKAKTTRKKAAR